MCSSNTAVLKEGRPSVDIVDHVAVVTGGFNVYPREIEDVLADDPSVSAVAVIGVPDPKWGEAVKAFVVPRPGATPDTAA